MKAIIIEEDRFVEVSEQMRSKSKELHENSYLCKQTGLTEDQMKYAADEISRAIHAVFVQWAHSHGASCIR